MIVNTMHYGNLPPASRVGHFQNKNTPIDACTSVFWINTLCVCVRVRAHTYFAIIQTTDVQALVAALLF